jgi:SAM-dependent methyltransferase
MSHLGGAFNPDPILFVPDIWEALIAEYKINSVLDVGCGYGHAVRWFIDRGLYATGVEGDANTILKHVAPFGTIIPHDYTTGGVALSRRFDLCWCCEFVEHVEAQHENNFISSFCFCDHLALTHATPGQGGFHHVNEQPSEYWIKRLRAHFDYDEDATMRYRRPAQYGVNNLLIFHRK